MIWQKAGWPQTGKHGKLRQFKKLSESERKLREV